MDTIEVAGLGVAVFLRADKYESFDEINTIITRENGESRLVLDEHRFVCFHGREKLPLLIVFNQVCDVV